MKVLTCSWWSWRVSLVEAVFRFVRIQIRPGLLRAKGHIVA
jgi:hypothetical protein